MNICNRLTHLRKYLNFNQIPFAKELGVSQSAYANYERGVTDIPISLAVKICVEYEVSPSWLLCGDGAMKSKGTGEIVEAASVALARFVAEKKIEITPEKQGLLIRYLYEEMTQGKLLNEDDQRRTLKIAT